MAEILAAFGGGMAALFAAWRMIAHYEKTNREEHAALMNRITGVEVRLGERIAAVEAKLDTLIALQKP